jgi:hypothetical protein
MKQSDLFALSETASSLTLGVLTYIAVTKIADEFRKNKQKNKQKEFSLTPDVAIYGEQDAYGNWVCNTEGKGKYLAQNYKGNDGRTYQVAANNEWYVLVGSSWERC